MKTKNGLFPNPNFSTIPHTSNFKLLKGKTKKTKKRRIEPRWYSSSRLRDPKIYTRKDFANTLNKLLTNPYKKIRTNKSHIRETESFRGPNMKLKI